MWCKKENVEKESRTNLIDLGVVEIRWEYSSEPRLEGLLKQLKYIKWKNVTNFNK